MTYTFLPRQLVYRYLKDVFHIVADLKKVVIFYYFGAVTTGCLKKSV